MFSGFLMTNYNHYNKETACDVFFVKRPRVMRFAVVEPERTTVSSQNPSLYFIQFSPIRTYIAHFSRTHLKMFLSVHVWIFKVVSYIQILKQILCTLQQKTLSLRYISHSETNLKNRKTDGRVFMLHALSDHGLYYIEAKAVKGENYPRNQLFN
jgi:hypothetical protein